MDTVAQFMREFGHARLSKDEARGRHPECKPSQMADWEKYWGLVKDCLLVNPMFTEISLQLSVKEDGHSATFQCSRVGVTVSYRTQNKKKIKVLPPDFFPEWAIKLNTSWSGEIHGTYKGKPLGFNKVRCLLHWWSKHDKLPPDVELFFTIFNLQRIKLSPQTADGFTGGEYDDDTTTGILQSLGGGTRKYGVTLRSVKIKRYTVLLHNDSQQLYFRIDGKTIARSHMEFKEYLLSLGSGIEGFVIKMEDRIFCKPKGAVWFVDWFQKKRLLSAIKCKQHYTGQLVMVMFLPVDSKETGRVLILLCKRNGNLVYAGKIQHSYLIPDECIPKVPLCTYRKIESVDKLFNTYSLHPDYLLAYPDCFTQVSASFTWVTSPRFCATGIKSKMDLLPLDIAKVDDTKHVAMQNPYWREVITTCIEFDKAFPKIGKKKRKAGSSGYPTDDEDEEEIPEPPLIVKMPPAPKPIEPPPKTDVEKSEFSQMVEDFTKGEHLRQKTPPESPRSNASPAPEDYYHLQDDPDDQRSLAESPHSETQRVPAGWSDDDEEAGDEADAQQTLVYQPVPDANGGGHCPGTLIASSSEEEEEEDECPLPVSPAAPCSKTKETHDTAPLKEVLDEIVDGIIDIALKPEDPTRWQQVYELTKKNEGLLDSLGSAISLEWLNLEFNPERSLNHRFAFLVREPQFYRMGNVWWFNREYQSRLRHNLHSRLT